MQHTCNTCANCQPHPQFGMNGCVCAMESQVVNAVTGLTQSDVTCFSKRYPSIQPGDTITAQTAVVDPCPDYVAKV